jgi:hypothetical protein
MLFISPSTQLLVQIYIPPFTCTTCFNLKGHHQVQEFLQFPCFLLSLPKLASVYTLGVCWTGIFSCNAPKTKLNSVALVREQTIPTEGPPLVGEVSANFCE